MIELFPISDMRIEDGERVGSEMGYGLWKLHHAAQTMEAKRDFARLANTAINAGRVDLVKKYFYPERAGWRTIDRCIAKLRKALNANG